MSMEVLIILAASQAPDSGAWQRALTDHQIPVQSRSRSAHCLHDEGSTALGRCEQSLRALVIAYGQRGYVALYSYEPRADVALILAIRHQSEADFQD